ncbi:MAG: hypothetical protein MJ189_03155, partial [Coriobacteriales bacterium]|nr:hypothetical protein [Coriobacteriales bacterium]
TQENLDTLRKRGVIIVEPSVGKLACGSVGKGHLASIQNIVDAISYNLYIEKPLAGKNVLITAGPTREYLDPVRFISNGSSGKFGYALARAAKCLGANVTLLSGPTNIDIPADVEFVQATSAKDMFEFITGHSSFFDIAIFNAAVCDWAAKDYSFEKITKTGNDLNLEFAQNSDIAQYFGQHKSSKQTSVIFNAQTSLDEQQSIQKLINKNADLVVSNIVGGKNNALASDVDDISIFNAEKLIAKYKDSKSKLAFIIFEEVIKRAMDDHIS